MREFKRIRMLDQIIETWQIHNRINLYLLDAIADEALGRWRRSIAPFMISSLTSTMCV